MPETMPKAKMEMLCASSASAYRCSEDVGIEAIILSKLKFSDVERHIFGRHFVERADNAAFEDRPKTFNRVGVNCADYVLMFVVIDGAVRILIQIIAIDSRLVGCQQTDFVGN